MAAVRFTDASVWSATVGNPYVGILVAYLAAIVALVTFALRRSVRTSYSQQAGNHVHVTLWRVATLISFASTWFYMIRYLFWSYDAFLERVRLTGGLVTAMPQCNIAGTQGGILCARVKLIAVLLRMADWLRDTSLFQEAWLYVVATEKRWWWSAEVCAFTVAPWALFLYVEGMLSFCSIQYTMNAHADSDSFIGKRKSIPHLWVYMLIGQMVAISVAQNLFHLALVARSVEVGRWVAASHESTPSKASPRGKMVPAPPQRTPSQLRMPPPESPSRTALSTHANQASVSAKTTMTSATLHTITLEAHPSMVARAMVSLLTLAGCVAVWLVPDSLLTILVMHFFPLLVVVLPPILRRTAPPRWLVRATAPKRLYTVFAIFGLLLRIKTTLAVAAAARKEALLSTLITTFFSHPAQSSISSDAVCITLSTSLFIFLHLGGHSQSQRQRREACTLAALAPITGPTFAFSAAMALQSKRDEISDEALRHMALIEQKERGEPGHLDDEFMVKQKITRSIHRDDSMTQTPEKLPQKTTAAAATTIVAEVVEEEVAEQSISQEDEATSSEKILSASPKAQTTQRKQARARGRGRQTRSREPSQ